MGEAATPGFPTGFFVNLLLAPLETGQRDGEKPHGHQHDRAECDDHQGHFPLDWKRNQKKRKERKKEKAWGEKNDESTYFSPLVPRNTVKRDANADDTLRELIDKLSQEAADGALNGRHVRGQPKVKAGEKERRRKREFYLFSTSNEGRPARGICTTTICHSCIEPGAGILLMPSGVLAEDRPEERDTHALRLPDGNRAEQKRVHAGGKAHNLSVPEGKVRV